MILTVMIPVLPKRYPLFVKLLQELNRQRDYMKQTHPTLGEVEIIFDDSKAFLDGGPSIGAKRNALKNRATGKYITYCDEDDNVAPNYLETLVRLCQSNADVITFRCMFKNDHYWTVLNMSLTNKENEETNPDRIIQRTPWQICPVKNEIAQLEHFDETLNHNEDWTWMERILKHVHVEEHTDQILTQYNHSERDSEADKILKAGHK